MARSPRYPNSALQRSRAGRGRVQAPDMAARQGSRTVPDVDSEPLGTCPREAAPRVKAIWRECARDWPQLSRRDRQALIEYCHLRIEQDDLRAVVDAAGRFDGEGKATAAYSALGKVTAVLHRMRIDFAGVAGHRSRAKAVAASTPASADPGSGAPLSKLAALRAVK